MELARFGRDRLEREIESLYRELLGQQSVSAREDSTDTVS